MTRHASRSDAPQSELWPDSSKYKKKKTIRRKSYTPVAAVTKLGYSTDIRVCSAAFAAEGFCCISFERVRGFMQKRLALLFLALVLVCLSAMNVMAQVNASATLQGTVTDKTGAVIPSADVKITNKQTGEARST